MMNRVQEMIDENMDQMPTALAKRLLDACKEEAEASPKLYKLTWTMVDSHAHIVEAEDEPDFARVTLSHKTQTLIVEAVDAVRSCGFTSSEMPNHGMVSAGWVKRFTEQPVPPLVLLPSDHMVYGGSDRMVIVHSIEPFCKRARDES